MISQSQYDLFESLRWNGQLRSGATFSECGNYRYRLWRIWDVCKPLVMCIGLNPSTANATKTDPTITNLTTALKHLGYGGFYMMNLFAFISSNPDDLLVCADPVKDNDDHLNTVASICEDEVIVCWGTFTQAEERIKEVLPRYPHAKCFGFNKNGTPMHPLYALMYKGMVKNPVLMPYKEAVNVNS